MFKKNRKSLLARASAAATLAASLSVLSAIPLVAQAQEIVPQLTKIDESEANIRLDGRLDEGIWQRIPVVDDMKVVIPDTLADASLETHTRIFYTERGIYVGIMNFQEESTLVARMTSRDTRPLRRRPLRLHDARQSWRFHDRRHYPARASA